MRLFGSGAVISFATVVRGLRLGVFDAWDRDFIPRIACYMMPCVGFGALDVQRSQGVECFMKNARLWNLVGFVASLGWKVFRVLG